MDILDIFDRIRLNTSNDMAAAILVLADVIDRKPMLDRSSAENLGHEISMAIQNSMFTISDGGGFQAVAEAIQDGSSTVGSSIEKTKGGECECRT